LVVTRHIESANARADRIFTKGSFVSILPEQKYCQPGISVGKSAYHSLSQREIGGGILRYRQLSVK
jgi:hypothetical protein